MLLKRLICFFIGHKHIQQNDIEEFFDDATTVQECCERCKCLLSHYTYYGMTNETDIHYIRKRWVK